MKSCAYLKSALSSFMMNGKTKYDLERANERLNRITGEIYIQNELLRYISTALDIRELIELVTDAIIGTNWRGYMLTCFI